MKGLLESFQPDHAIAFEYYRVLVAKVLFQLGAQGLGFHSIKQVLLYKRTIVAEPLRLLDMRNGVDAHDVRQNIGALHPPRLEGWRLTYTSPIPKTNDPDRLLVDRRHHVPALRPDHH